MADGPAADRRGHEGGPPRGPHQREPKGVNVAETIIWLLVILGLLVLVMQGTGYIKLFQLQSKAAAIGLGVIAVALAVAAAYSYLQGIKLRAAIERLTELQRRGKNKQRVTLPDPVEAGETAIHSEEDDVWTEQVRFTAVIEERQRLARELHDAVSQQLFAISMTATAVSRTLEKDWERAKRQVQLIEEMAAVAQSEMRALLLHLRPVHLDGKNLAQALQGLVDELKQKVPMAIKLELDETIRCDTDTEDHLFRIAQEALSNTLRHSKADQMEIVLQRIDGYAHLILSDNGVGFDLESKKQTSYGLLTMEERVTVLGGSLSLNTAPGQGVRIDIRVPLTS
ncbi:NarL family two-component system sensor histidine kinase LiaS [Paenibacillus phyllosphaerae]|uniref:histidine kinase n=1 Tax=Paenibacillus phyllosphaerae TaxID=274593 RepID=A0A7W5FS59_9BACL|nr:sensor histidine kinase [Paenibacillus phyllosphaerae]MBB3114704.1 NarL family two-component system sensor histidine kinase LiaS [Paenibacillus phyllosphaerae]